MSRAIPRPFGESNNKPTDEEHQYHLQRLTEYLRANDIPISNLSNDNSLNIRKSVYSEEELQAQAAAAQLLKQNAQPPKMTLNDLINQTWQNISPETLSPAQVTPPYNQELYDKAYNWQNKILAQPSFGQPYLQQDNLAPTNIIPVPERKPTSVDYDKYGADFSKEMIDAMLNDQDFQRAMIKTRENEGGYVNDPNDPGGETNFGISTKTYPNEDIKNLTRERADAIMYRDYWKKYGINKLPSPLAEIVYDNSVNQGQVKAIQHLHRALGITPGTIIGEKTMKALSNKKDFAEIENKYKEEVKKRYKECIAKNPKLKNFEKAGIIV